MNNIKQLVWRCDVIGLFEAIKPLFCIQSLKWFETKIETFKSDRNWTSDEVDKLIKLMCERVGIEYIKFEPMFQTQRSVLLEQLYRVNLALRYHNQPDNDYLFDKLTYCIFQIDTFNQYYADDVDFDDTGRHFNQINDMIEGLVGYELVEVKQTEYENGVEVDGQTEVKWVRFNKREHEELLRFGSVIQTLGEMPTAYMKIYNKLKK
jgi:hypothetical protein